MSLLVMGISHHSAPMDVLEKVATIDAEETLPVLGAGDAVGEVLLLSTCNRIEVYTEVSRFHAAVAAGSARAAAQAAGARGLDTVVLSGGVFQNALLLRLTAAALREAGLRVLVPELLPPNDGGISFGQAAVAAARLAG